MNCKKSYLLGEEIAFQMNISKNKLFTFGNFSVQLVQQTIYSVPKAAKSLNLL